MRYRRRYRRRSAYGSTRLINYIFVILIIILLVLILRLMFKSFLHPKLPMDRVTAFEIDTIILKALGESTNIDRNNFIQQIALLSMDNDYQVEDDVNIQQINFEDLKKKHKGKNLEALYQIYAQAIMDIEYFPIPEVAYLNEGNKPNYFYINTWGAKRTYGGERPHLGTDILDSENMRGRLPVISMTSGTIEQMGWNEKGGWRVGVRAPHGAYFYYAHLDSYAQNLSQGMHIQSGQLIGFMGDTGYSKKPGTVGNFPVHLHIGIMLNLEFIKEETWINPYHMLEFIENKKLKWNPQDYDS